MKSIIFIIFLILKNISISNCYTSIKSLSIANNSNTELLSLYNKYLKDFRKDISNIYDYNRVSNHLVLYLYLINVIFIIIVIKI
jgi:hypothetical protein